MILTKKRRLRLEIRQQTALLPREEKLRQSEEVFRRLEKMDIFKKARNIGFFWSLSDEIPTQEVIQRWIKRKNVYLPIIHGKEDLLFGRFLDKCRMEEVEFRLLVPTGTEIIDPSELDLLIVPGVAYDSFGRRLGKGKGYYDRFMEKNDIYTIGVCLKHQLIGEIPSETHDRKVDMVVTPEGTFVRIERDKAEMVKDGVCIPADDMHTCENPA